MTEKEIKIVREQAVGLPDDLFKLVLERLERALQDRPFWLKVFHFLKGNAKWIEETVREIVQRVRDEFSNRDDVEIVGN